VTSLTWKQLNRSVLVRQMLLERSRLPLHRVVERIGGVQAQYVPSAYVGLWSRIEGFERDTLTRALHRGSVVQATLMRGTIHLVSRADYWPIAAAIRDTMRDWWLRVTRSDRTPADMAETAARAKRILASGPKKRKELIAELGIETQEWSGLGYWVELVRIPPSGTWDSRRADLYGLAAEWVGPDFADPRSGRDLLIRRYLGGFGPATREDIRSFTGFNLSAIDDSLERLSPRTFTSDDATLFDIRGKALPEPDTVAPVRFLGTWDATLLVHARRALILPEEYRGRIFHTKAPHSFNTFLVDGQVRGIWREEGGEIRLEPFEPIPRMFRRDVENESERLAGLYLR
jgi:hypothetical protein